MVLNINSYKKTYKAQDNNRFKTLFPFVIFTCVCGVHCVYSCLHVYGRWRPKVGCQGSSSITVSHYLRHGLSVTGISSLSHQLAFRIPLLGLLQRELLLSSVDSNVGSHALTTSTIITKQSSQSSNTPFSMGKE